MTHLNSKLILTGTLATLLVAASLTTVLLRNGADGTQETDLSFSGYARSEPTREPQWLRQCVSCGPTSGTPTPELPPESPEVLEEDEGNGGAGEGAWWLVTPVGEAELGEVEASGDTSDTQTGEDGSAAPEDASAEPSGEVYAEEAPDEATVEEETTNSQRDEPRRSERHLPEPPMPERQSPAERELERTELPEREAPEREIPERDLPEREAPRRDLPEAQLPERRGEEPSYERPHRPAPERPEDPERGNASRPEVSTPSVPERNGTGAQTWYEREINASATIGGQTFEGLGSQHVEAPHATLPATCTLEVCTNETAYGGTVATPPLHVNETEVGPVMTVEEYHLEGQELAAGPGVRMHAICSYAADVCPPEQQVGGQSADTPAVDGVSTDRYAAWTSVRFGAGLDASGRPAAQASAEPGFGSS